MKVIEHQHEGPYLYCGPFAERGVGDGEAAEAGVDDGGLAARGLNLRGRRWKDSQVETIRGNGVHRRPRVTEGR